MSSRSAIFLCSCVVVPAVSFSEPAIVVGQDAGVAVNSATIVSSDNEPEFTKLSLASFDQVWQSVLDRAWNEDFDEEKWQAARAELRPKIEKASSLNEVREILGELLNGLKLSHYSIVPAEVYGHFEGGPGATSNKFESGISVRIVDKKAIVSKVWESGDAYDQGVRPGWQLVSLQEKPTVDFVAGLNESLADGSAYRAETLAALMIEAQLQGATADQVPVTFKDMAGEVHELQIKLHPARGEKISYGHVPTLYVSSEAKQVDDGIGYVSFTYFFAPLQVMGALDRAIDFSERGLIIDLRGNIGGLAPMTMGLGNKLVSEKKKYKLGVQRMRQNEINYVLTPSHRPFTGKVAVLVDECSVSSSEILAGGLQSIGRARIFGTRSAGAALPAIFHKLPNGDRFQFAIADFVDANGNQIEGNGVIPDVEVPLSVAALAAGKDPALDAAVAWIKSN